MSIDRLSSTSALIAALRAEVARKSERGTRGAGSSAVRTGHPMGPTGRRDPSVLRGELTEIANSIPKGDAQALDAARPRVVRAVLLWEFGPELREYGEWQPMLDRLVETLERNEAHREAFASLIEELRR